jgi:hypothetical protein
MTACVVAAAASYIPRMGPFGARFLYDLGGLAVGRSGEDELHAGFGQLGNFVTTGDDECEVRQRGKMLSYKSASVSQLPIHTSIISTLADFTSLHCGIHSSSVTSPARHSVLLRSSWRHRTAVSFVPALLPP